MKKIMLLIIVIMSIGATYWLITPFASAQTSSEYIRMGQAKGWNITIEKQILSQMKNNKADALYVIHNQEVIIAAGDTDQISNVASVRKSLISGLYGIAVSKGLINLEDSLEKLKIDDLKNPLTPEEKKATVGDLLKSRSGIYIEAIGESKKMKEKRPERGSHSADEFYYYNNWDFNVLGVVFEQETQMKIGEAFYEWIAKPTGMKKFKPENVIYQESPNTSIPMYRFYMCAEDLARFGSLYVNDGKWQEEQIIPPEWIKESFTSYSLITDVAFFDGYGYLWWLDNDVNIPTRWAIGSGGQYIVIDPKNNLVIAMTNNTGNSPIGTFLYRLFGEESPYAEPLKIHQILKENI